MAEPTEWAEVDPAEFYHTTPSADGTISLEPFTAGENGWYRYDSATGYHFLGPDDEPAEH